jgi:hypothetical protein
MTLKQNTKACSGKYQLCQDRKRWMSQLLVTTMLVCFFHRKGIVYYEFIKQSRPVNQHCYLEVLTRLCESARQKRPELWPHNWTSHHDNVPFHDAIAVCEFLAKKWITKLDHPTYSPHLAPWEFSQFPKLKDALKSCRFDDISDNQCHVVKELKNISDDLFQECFEQWKHHLNVLMHTGITLKVTVYK